MSEKKTQYKKILLLKPRHTILREGECYFTLVPPLGIGYIASFLEREGYQVKILDVAIEAFSNQQDNRYSRKLVDVGLSDDDITKIIDDFSPDVIGISNPSTPQFNNSIDLARFIKETHPSLPLVLGGVHPSSCPEDCFVDNLFNFIVVGEGEQSMLQILQYLNEEIPATAIESTYIFQDKYVMNPQRSYLKDLDELPFPAYHLMSIDKYYDFTTRDSSTRGGGQRKWSPLITSRGCPYDCNFCSVFLMEGKKWRSRSPENIVKEIELLMEQYEIRTFTIEDSNFTLDLKRAEQFCSLVIEKKLDIEFSLPNGIRADRMTPELARKLKLAGCKEVTLAIEHGDQEFLDKTIKKKLDLSKIICNIKELRKNNIPMTGFFILGIPPESPETMEKTKRFCYKVAKHGLLPIFNFAMPLPGTELFEYCKENQCLDKEYTPVDYLETPYTQPLLTSKAFSKDELIRIKGKLARNSLVLFLLFHPILFVKLPFFQATLKDLTNWERFKLRLIKIKGILGK